MDTKPPKDRIWVTLGAILLVSIPVEMLLGVWLDWRWWPTALLTTCFAAGAGHLSNLRDKNLKKRFDARTVDG